MENMKQIPLGDGLFALVDNIDYEKVAIYRWLAAKPKKKGGIIYAYRKERVVSEAGAYRYKTIYMHNVIGRPSPGKWIDHRDHDGLNNGRRNLRVCEWRENLFNRRKRSDSKNEYKGVIRISNGKKRFKAQIIINGRRIRSKPFYTEEDAALEYNEMAKRFHGDFACLNVVISKVDVTRFTLEE